MLKKITFLLTFLFASTLMLAQTVALEESFETDGNGTRYTTTTPEFTDGFNDFFLRTDGSDINSSYEVSGADGSFFFAAHDIDGEGAAPIQSLDFTGIDISGLSNLSFVMLAAEDDDSANQDWDADALVFVEVQVDGGGYTKILQFASQGGTNTEPGLDTDFDGVADSTPLSSAFQTFNVDLGVTGTVADLRVTFANLDAGDEDISIDHLRLIDNFTVTPTVTITAPTDGQVFADGTTSVDLEFTTANAPAGSTVNVIVDGVTTQDAASPFAIPTSNGETYNVTVELKDSGNATLDSNAISFSVAFPCDLFLGDATTDCDTQTAGTDTYTTSIPFTNGGTSTYTINTGGVGVVGGDDPSAVTEGTITITLVDEGTDFTVNILGDTADSGCDLTRFISAPTCVATAACPGEGAIIITEILQNPDGTDTNKEYFEVYNTTATPIDMMGWIISDAGSDSFTVETSVIIAPNSYAVFANEGDAALNGGITNVAYEYDGMALANGDDEIILSCTGTVIDQVFYDGGAEFPDPDGASMELAIDALNSTDNDLGSNWGTATSTYGDGTDMGTPGAPNDFVLATENFNKQTFVLFPNPTANGSVTINTTNSSDTTVAIYSILGKKVVSQKLTNNTLNVSALQSGIYLVKVTQDGAVSTQKLIVR